MSEHDDRELDEVGERLRSGRPAPAPGFRGALARAIAARRLPPARPTRLRLRVAVLASLGGALLLVGALSALGLGPLAA